MSKAVATAVAVESPINKMKREIGLTDQPNLEIVENKKRVKVLQNQIDLIGFREQNLTRAEENAKAEITKLRLDLEKERDELKLVGNLKDMPQLSLEPLKWRSEQGWPQLIVLGTEEPLVRFFFGVSRGDYRSGARKCELVTNPELPMPILECYEDVIGRLFTRATSKQVNLDLTSHFTGIFPVEIRQVIRQAKTKFDQVFIIAEAQKWELTESKPVVVPHNADPLVVGWKNNKLYLIDSFDLTTVENYVRSEFRV